jgi:hypothetical protein
VKIIQDESQTRSFYPDIAQVKASQHEVMLLFGKAHLRHLDRNELLAKLIDRIVLNPVGAKRFAGQLNKGIRAYESTFGALDGKNIIHKGLKATPVLRPPPFKFAKGSQRVDQLFDFIRQQNITPAFEHSFKVMKKTVFENRFLLGFEKNLIRINPDEKIADICKQMGMPGIFLEKFKEKLPGSNIVGFGFGEDERGCIVKAYLEFGNRFFRAFKRKSSDKDPYLSHLGFKWDAGDNTRKSLTRYTCYPGYSSKEMMDRLSDSFYHKHTGTPLEILNGILDLASSRVDSSRFMFLDVREEDSQRSSFDINVYGATLRLKELYPFLSNIFQHYDLTEAQFQKIFGQVKDHVLGHLAGGTGRKGEDFLTLYSGE